MTTPTTILRPSAQARMDKGGRKNKAKIEQVVEMLGRMDDRHKQALAAGDCRALVELAAEYDAVGCPRLANEIRIEAGNL